MHELELNFSLNHRALRSFTVKCILQWLNGKIALHPLLFEPLHLMVAMVTGYAAQHVHSAQYAVEFQKLHS